jgi:hypothetical protein
MKKIIFATLLLGSLSSHSKVQVICSDDIPDFQEAVESLNEKLSTPDFSSAMVSEMPLHINKRTKSVPMQYQQMSSHGFSKIQWTYYTVCLPVKLLEK